MLPAFCSTRWQSAKACERAEDSLHVLWNPWKRLRRESIFSWFQKECNKRSIWESGVSSLSVSIPKGWEEARGLMYYNYKAFLPFSLWWAPERAFVAVKQQCKIRTHARREEVACSIILLMGKVTVKLLSTHYSRSFSVKHCSDFV